MLKWEEQKRYTLLTLNSVLRSTVQSARSRRCSSGSLLNQSRVLLVARACYAPIVTPGPCAALLLRKM